MSEKKINFSREDISKIAKVLGVKPKEMGNNFRFELEDRENRRKIALEIYPDISIGAEKGNLITVFTNNAHLQLHFCTGYVVSEMMEEVIFVGNHDGRVSGLIIEKQASCSLYANVDEKILSGDFTKLTPEVMPSAVALSLTEHLI